MSHYSQRGGGSRRPNKTSGRSQTSTRRNQKPGSRSSHRGNRNHGDSSRRRSRRVIPTFNPVSFINKNPQPQQPDTYTAKHTFADFGLKSELVQVITGLGFSVPTPIQDQIIPEILKGHDVVGLAETGTGKTAAFLVPLIHRTLSEKNQQSLIITPTRELAIQIESELRKLTPHMQIFSTVCVGGTSIRPQIKKLQKTNQFIIGTPGRLLDLIRQGYLKPAQVTSVVLDEADRMLDMGFIGDIRSIIKNTPKKRSTLFFSATMSAKAEPLINEFLVNPITISVKKRDVTTSIAQDVVPYDDHHKFDTLTSLLGQDDFRRVLVFGTMKHSVQKLSEQLSAHGVTADAIHGNKSHGQRQRALQKFKSGQVRVLVATDVAARGIHVDNVSHVINYDLPESLDTYVHRIGRTGRGDKTGQALTFVPKHSLERQGV